MERNWFDYPPEENKLKDNETRLESDRALVQGGAGLDMGPNGETKIIASQRQKDEAKQEMESALEFRRSTERREELASFLREQGLVTDAGHDLFKVAFEESTDDTSILHVRESKPKWYNKNRKKWVANVNFGQGTIETDNAHMGQAMRLADEIEKRFGIHFNPINVIDSPEIKAQIHDETDTHL